MILATPTYFIAQKTKVRTKKMSNPRNVYVCRRIKLYNYLINRGFHVEQVRGDKFDPKRLVWIFANSPQLEQAVTDYYAMKN